MERIGDTDKKVSHLIAENMGCKFEAPTFLESLGFLFGQFLKAPW